MQDNDHEGAKGLSAMAMTIPQSAHLNRKSQLLAERAGQPYAHMLDGDGYVAQFSFGADGVHFRSRYVQTRCVLENSLTFRMMLRCV